MKKALIVASVASMIDQFNMPNIKLLQNLGYEVHVATNFEQCGSITSEHALVVHQLLLDMGVKVEHVPIPRSIFAVKSIIRSYRSIKKMRLEHEYEIMHCHSPIGGAISRFAFMTRKGKRQKNNRVIYTAHGLHFYDGAPLKNWLVFYPVEKLCAHFTDVLITINREDYEFAKRKLKAKKVEYVPGVGINVDKFANIEIDKVAKRTSIGVPSDVNLLLSVGELNENKNHETVIRAIAKLNDKSIHYVIAGKGHLHDQLLALADELGVSEQVHLLGFRRDVAELYHAADVLVHPSYREGLPVSVMEAMASGLPVVCSRIRGNVDLIDENGGKLFDPHSIEDCKEAIKNVVSDKMCEYGKYNCKKAKRYGLDHINEIMESIYKKQSTGR